MLKGEVDVTLRGHQFEAVADAELIFDRHGRQRAVTLPGEFADKLLALGEGVAVLIVLVIVMGMAAQEAFGVPAVLVTENLCFPKTGKEKGRNRCCISAYSKNSNCYSKECTGS